ncbi:MAG: transketolase [Nitrospirae bacterium]|nr:transketolase [Nitrospirota bacterium]
MENLDKISCEIRKRLLHMHSNAKASHIASSLSSVEILAALYFSILKIFPEDPKHPLRDRFIMSKGHAASALYAVLAFRELIPMQWLENYHFDGSNLPGHPVLMSDGEVQEGTTWESANNASRLQLDNLIAIIDANKWQAYERTDNIMPIHSFKPKWEAFGWSVKEVEGHNIERLTEVFKAVPFEKGKPSLVIAHTIKGKGISAFEDKMEWHYQSPNQEDLETYLRELNEKGIR